ncbi:iron-containing alcohol dehydrogenase, partial [Enterocloster citroniae]|nr:iron-containing alcohol dehydrogenase [Enterocloster citroniae]
MADTFIAPGRIISGRRALDMAADAVAKLGKKALVVTDDIMRQLGNLDKVTDMLMKAGVSYAVFTGVSG